MHGAGLADHAGSGLPALVMSVALVGLALGALLVVTAILAPRFPALRVMWKPLSIAIIVLQLMDGATTWVGVSDPFGFRLPPYKEQVYLSALVLEKLGGAYFLVIKGFVGIAVVYALDHARRAAVRSRERFTVQAVQVGILGIAVAPVVNNVGNFLAVA